MRRALFLFDDHVCVSGLRAFYRMYRIFHDEQDTDATSQSSTQYQALILLIM
jgi:hypothetical protein